MKVIAPNPPRLSDDLLVWDESTKGEVEVDTALVTGTDFAGAVRVSIDASRLESVLLTGLSLDKIDMADTACVKMEAAALQAYKANFLRVVMTDCRLTGAEFAEGHFEDCLFRNVKFDETGFRFAKFKRVRFENCIVRSSDFSNAKFDQVTFAGCDLEKANFISADCKAVDITTENLTTVKGVLGLKGATISSEQLMQLAPLLAAELGFHVEDAL